MDLKINNEINVEKVDPHVGLTQKEVSERVLEGRKTTLLNR
ncbi:Uncharacterised protein [Listeria fleischmannii subsp. fleischmannii]|uniref:Uncharacterized protein n=1 Tax=Listeria fleischmannii subsp. fleischmannii TaxID=1671902 RepID=A0A2X3GUY3_9LIST|nr:Uncharacterised protein [Listeria fleischmannii subsp. fleischmannii]